jgi:glycosyltransferase involved in cell wall biosynthesis
MKILYLYSEIMPYNIPVLEEFVNEFKADVHVVHWDQKKLTPYKLPANLHVTFYRRSELNRPQLSELAININPDVIFVSGWMDKGYLPIVRHFRKKRIPVVAGFDDQWNGSLRQHIAAIIFPLILYKYFSHAWVAGPLQYEYARRIGFKKRSIMFNLYSADTKLFNNVYDKSRKYKKKFYPHRFLYVGRLEYIKGIKLLIDSWAKIKSKRKNWDLVIIGDGLLKALLKKEDGIILKNFMDQESFLEDILNSGCLILPSISEPWALVLHEFSAAGLPIICSDACGAAPIFVTNGFNGYVFKKNCLEDLEEKILRIINTTDEELFKMAEKSHLNGQKITPEISAASFMSILQ